tara:strand:- start:1219 stop:2079 length:861 start_codon:yes stop_codon:yes gene_type:complete
MTTVVGCARQCSYCPQDNLSKAWSEKKPEERKVRLMTKEIFTSMLNLLPKNIYIYWTGYAEPMQAPDFHTFVKEASSRGIRGEISTTLHTNNDENIYALADRKHLDKLSLHLPDQKGYMKSVVNDKFFERLDFVVRNCLKEGDLIHFFGPLNNDIISFLKEPQYRTYLEGVKVDEIPMDDVDALTSRAGNIETANTTYHSSKVFCAARRLRQPVILPNGDLYICCMDYSLSAPLGNIFKSNYVDIIENNIKYFRKSQPEICHKCEWAEPKSMRKSSLLYVKSLLKK